MNRVLGAASRRLGRPELLAAFDGPARRDAYDKVSVNAVLASALGGSGSYVDVGANRGQVLRQAVRIAPRGRHVAFEPIPELAAEIASAFPGVDCRNVALGARTEIAQFCHFRALDGWSGLRRSPEISDQRGRPEYISVTVSTLDAELVDLTPSVIKIDVEGAEVAVLQGGCTVLSRALPVVIFEHVASAAALYGSRSVDLWELLTSLGYSIFTATGDGPFTRAGFASSSSVVNWLAAPNH